MKDDILARSAQLNWHPAHMKVRMDQWTEGLKYDWNISRQRFYGVPSPSGLVTDAPRSFWPTSPAFPSTP